MKPTIGRIVHYVSHGTPVRDDGSQAYASVCRAAVVTVVPGPGVAGLAILNPSGLFFHEAVPYDDALDPGENGFGAKWSAHAAGTWHWPCVREEP